jgi:hypothetical protein
VQIHRQFKAPLWFFIACSSLSGAISQAEDFDVPPGDVQALIEAIEIANGNGNSGYDNVILAPGSVYVLTEPIEPGKTCREVNSDSGLPAITSKIRIRGNGSTIRRGNTNERFRILTVCDSGDLSLIRVTLANGDDFSPELEGGGAVLNVQGDLYVTECTLIDNRTSRYGGAIATISGSTFIDRCTLANNTAGVHGGALRNRFFNTFVRNTTMSGNWAQGQYGTVFNVGGDVDVIACTMIDNLGGGFDNAGGPNGEVGAIFVYGTIVDSQGIDCYRDHPIISGGNNIVSDFTCDFNAMGDMLGVDPMVGPLQDNGGPTWTHEPVPGSPAIDAYDGCMGYPILGIDQRFIFRPQPDDGDCDVGAVEVVQGNGPGDFNGDGDVDLYDFAEFLDCVTGPGQPQPDHHCDTFDMDRDSDIDKADLAVFFLLFTG